MATVDNELSADNGPAVKAPKATKATASLGSLSTGTVVAGIGSIIGQSSHIGELLILLAPAATAASNVLITRLMARLQRTLSRRDEDKEVKAAAAILQNQLTNESLSIEHKEQIRLKLEKLYLVQADNAVARALRAGELPDL